MVIDTEQPIRVLYSLCQHSFATLKFIYDIDSWVTYWGFFRSKRWVRKCFNTQRSVKVKTLNQLNLASSSCNLSSLFDHSCYDHHTIVSYNSCVILNWKLSTLWFYSRAFAQLATNLFIKREYFALYWRSTKFGSI